MKIAERLFYLAVIVLLILALLRTCNRVQPCPDVVPLKTDTVWLPAQDSTPWYQPKVQFLEGGNIEAATHKPKPEVIQPAPRSHGLYLDGGDTAMTYPLYNFEEGVPVTSEWIFREPVRVSEIVYYSDTVAVQYGQVVIQDTLKYNRLQSRRVLSFFNFPEVTSTVSIVPKPKAQWYLGFDALGGPKNWLHGAGPSILLITKGGKGIEAGTYFTKGQQLYRLGAKFKL